MVSNVGNNSPNSEQILKNNSVNNYSCNNTAMSNDSIKGENSYLCLCFRFYEKFNLTFKRK